jgi:hypothetical protein
MRTKEVSARVAAFRIAAALDHYETDVRALADRRYDLALWRRIAGRSRQLRIQCAALPRLSVSSMAVLMSQVRLLRAVCARAGPRTQAVLQEHLRAIEVLRGGCVRIMGGQGTVLGMVRGC